MTRLDLVRRVFVECGLSGDGPDTTLNQSGEALQVVQYVDDAWRQVQQMRRWRWMWELASITVLSGDSYVADSIPANQYIHDTAFIGMVDIAYVPWDQWRIAYPTITATGSPSEWTIRPDNAFTVNTLVSSDTTILVERYINPTTMDADDDTPSGLPVQHHMVIVWEAVRMYAGYDEANKLYQHATSMRAQHLTGMRRETNPVELW